MIIIYFLFNFVPAGFIFDWKNYNSIMAHRANLDLDMYIIGIG